MMSVTGTCKEYSSTDGICNLADFCCLCTRKASLVWYRGFFLIIFWSVAWSVLRYFFFFLKICDIPMHHPSISKQHAAWQYRLVSYEHEDGTTRHRVRCVLTNFEDSSCAAVQCLWLHSTMDLFCTQYIVVCGACQDFERPFLPLPRYLASLFVSVLFCLLLHADRTLLI